MTTVFIFIMNRRSDILYAVPTIRLQEQYEQAVQFRKRGFTYSEISKIVGVSKGTVSAWLSKKAFSKKVRVENTLRAARDNVQRIQLVNKARARERTTRYKEAQKSAQTEYRHYSKDPAFIAGLVAYMALGDQTHPSRIRFSSTSPSLHRLFARFCHSYLGTKNKDIRFWIIIPSSLKEEKERRHWSRKTGIPLPSFYRTQYIPNKKTARALQHGTGNTIIGNTVLKKKLLQWVELYAKELS